MDRSIRKNGPQSGFTLVELIVSIVIMGFIAAVAGLGLVQLSEGYLIAKMNAATAQKGQLALNRMIKEFSQIESISSGGPTGIAYRARQAGSHAIQLSGDKLLYDGVVLTDSVGGFDMSYQSGLSGTAITAYVPGTHDIINVRLTISGAEGSKHVFTGRVFLRLRHKVY